MAKPNNNLSAEYVRAALDYDPETGVLTWKHRDDMRKEWNSRYALREAGCTKNNNYLRVRLGGILYVAHRLAVLIVTGSWPEDEVDHIDGARNNNAWNNLRIVSRVENMRNSAMHKNNSTGFAGITIGRGKYVAQIMVFGKNIFLGYYDTLAEAASARAAANIKYGFHPNHGRIQTHDNSQ